MEGTVDQEGATLPGYDPDALGKDSHGQFQAHWLEDMGLWAGGY